MAALLANRCGLAENARRSSAYPHALLLLNSFSQARRLATRRNIKAEAIHSPVWRRQGYTKQGRKSTDGRWSPSKHAAENSKLLQLQLEALCTGEARSAVGAHTHARGSRSIIGCPLPQSPFTAWRGSAGCGRGWLRSPQPAAHPLLALGCRLSQGCRPTLGCRRRRRRRFRPARWLRRRLGCLAGLASEWAAVGREHGWAAGFEWTGAISVTVHNSHFHGAQLQPRHTCAADSASSSVSGKALVSGFSPLQV